MASSHPILASRFVENAERTRWHDQALWYVREKRDAAAGAVQGWEQLREQAATVKAHTLSKLGVYLEQFEAQAQARGAEVHWARDATEHNSIVLAILKRHAAQRVVKSKSMLTEECGLNHFLEKHQIQVTDTDLGEWIVQLRREPPSHIVLPAIHIKKAEIGELFAKEIGTDPKNCDPKYLTDAACRTLRQKFLEADVAITGANFLVAETGAAVVCTNEGNADLGTSLPAVHIVCVGMEKLLPRQSDLAVFLRLLARSATGQPITTYSSHFSGPMKGGELHFVLVDNGRIAQLARPKYRRSLSCIRCGACMNTCPVYRRSGGYSYAYTIPGPIGSILGPQRDLRKHASLPFASSLCGSCTDVCPVKINLHEQLLLLRGEVYKNGLLSLKKTVPMRIAKQVLRSPWLYEVSGSFMRMSMRLLPRAVLYNRLNVWGKAREIPPAPKESFREWYRKNR